MKFVAAATVAALAVAVSAQKTLEYEIKKGIPGLRMGRPLPPLVGKRFGKRDTLTSMIVNNITGGGYYIDVEVGTPGQPMTMILDTGSSDAWILDVEADLCHSKTLQEKHGDYCSPTYDSSKSSTYKLAVEDGFRIQYLDSSEATGDYITDDFKIANMTIKDLQMGLADKVAMGTGVLGIGFPENVAATDKYPNIIDQLAEQGVINSRAYSLYLNDRRSATGNILFGGIDTNKFMGELSVLPIQRYGLKYSHFVVSMSDLTLTYNGQEESALQAVVNSTGVRGASAILDSGTTLSYLPDKASTILVEALNAYTDYAKTGLTFIDCGLLSSDMKLTFVFNHTTSIVVPVQEMVLDMLDGLDEYFPPDLPFDDVCLFGIQSTNSFGDDMGATSLLGDTFLRSAYVVYDLDHKQIGMAQANWNSTETQILELSSDSDSLPAATGVQDGQATTTATDTVKPSRTAGGGSSTTDAGKETVTVTSTPVMNAARAISTAGVDVLGVMVLAGVFSIFGGGVLFML
ncbi:hypothetical protein DL546_004105 [Coniochaeta pulveracea]|uniref:Peptidase A1 domain-containing protein n=1 Tax=Coniochaeta pulveracea TaxID=177199 RepID=A0A420Y5Y4_9PEZI|nr:hypothetical protein DL546_004105 [Coniochaeta pulveracea]